jgi:hypothetical protein
VGDQLSLQLAPVTQKTYQSRGINVLQHLFKEHFQGFAEQYEAKHAIIYGRFRIERITEVVEKFILCGDYSQGIARSSTWARLIAQVQEVDPLACPRRSAPLFFSSPVAGRMLPTGTSKPTRAPTRACAG